MYPFSGATRFQCVCLQASFQEMSFAYRSSISLAFSSSVDLSRSSAAFRRYNTIFHWRDRFLLILFWCEILLRLGVVSWPHLLALCVEGCCCMYDVKSVFRSECTRRSSCCLWFPFLQSDICYRLLLYSLKICLAWLRNDSFWSFLVWAHWRRTVAAFVSLCVQDCCRMYVKSFIAQLRSDLLPAACRDFRPSRTSAIACCIQWKSVWIGCAVVSCWSFLVWSFLHIGVVSWPHLSVSVFNIAVVCL
jgi:hypothetical protein